MFALMMLLCFFSLNVAPASPPQNVFTRVVSSSEIQVNWTEVLEIDQNGEVVMYEVFYVSQMTINGTVTTNNLSIILSGLEEYVEYNISVRAYTSVGPGPYSVMIVASTVEDGKLSLSNLKYHT